MRNGLDEWGDAGKLMCGWCHEQCPWSCGCDPADFDVLVNSFLNFFKEVDLYTADKHEKVKPTPPQTRLKDHGMVDRAALRHGPKKPIKKMQDHFVIGPTIVKGLGGSPPNPP